MDYKALILAASILVTLVSSTPEPLLTVDGDMEISLSEYISLTRPSVSYGAGKRKKWPYAKDIPYRIHSSIKKSKFYLGLIMDALKEIETYTCLTFKESPKASAYINFISSGSSSCSSRIGFHFGANNVKIGVFCPRRGLVLHEIMHSLGFYHEQNRPDRDTFVKINYGNIADGVSRNFDKFSSIDSLGSPYDYDSIMHYGSMAASKNGKKTIEAVDPKDTPRLGQRLAMSLQDIAQIHKLYNCPGKPITYPPTQPPTTPQNYPSCKDFYLTGSRTNGAYELTSSGKSYCHMGNLGGCGTGGWTQVLKIQPYTKSFSYTANIWRNRNDYFARNLGMKDRQNLLAKAYSTVSFTKLCIGMKDQGVIRWTRVDYSAKSLYDVLADGKYKPISKSAASWGNLVKNPVVYQNCQKGGFNIDQGMKTRIGIVSSSTKDCSKTDSRLGLGNSGGGYWSSSGNSHDRKTVSLQTYVFVQ